jgi:hypothetical protein
MNKRAIIAILSHLNTAMFALGYAETENKCAGEPLDPERIKTIKRRIVRLRNEAVRKYEIEEV